MEALLFLLDIVSMVALVFWCVRCERGVSGHA